MYIQPSFQTYGISITIEMKIKFILIQNKSMCIWIGYMFFFISMVYFWLRLAYKITKKNFRSCLGHAQFFAKSGSFHAYMLSYITLGLSHAYTRKGMHHSALRNLVTKLLVILIDSPKIWMSQKQNKKHDKLQRLEVTIYLSLIHI